jgi:hypothetical protein
MVMQMSDILHLDINSVSDIDRAVAEIILHHQRENSRAAKKITTIGFRSSPELKADFIDACNGLDYSSVLEQLVKKFIECNNERNQFQSINVELSII